MPPPMPAIRPKRVVFQDFMLTGDLIRIAAFGAVLAVGDDERDLGLELEQLDHDPALHGQRAGHGDPQQDIGGGGFDGHCRANRPFNSESPPIQTKSATRPPIQTHHGMFLRTPQMMEPAPSPTTPTTLPGALSTFFAPSSRPALASSVTLPTTSPAPVLAFPAARSCCAWSYWL